MRVVRQLTNNKYLNIKEVVDPENNVNGFQFAERRGVDSVAFICYDGNSEQFLLNSEYKPPVSKMVLGAFGGSFDKDKEPIDIVLDEVKEEAGFSLDKEQVKFVGKVLVSTQMNQYCHLFIAFVNKDEQGEREPENKIEEMAKTEWHDFDDVYELEDWKPITIIGMAQSKGLIGVP